jgi:hypothetical protein
MSDDKIINIFDREREPKEKTESGDEELSFEEIMKRNAENKARLERERKKDNSKVKRSYRLEPKKK